jgi:hypothetical protein
MAMFYSGAIGVAEAEDDPLALPTREELVGADPDPHYDWLSLDEEVTPQVVAFDPTLSTAGVTDFFDKQGRERDRAAVTSILGVPIVPPVPRAVATDEGPPLRRFADQFDRFAVDFHAFAIECQQRGPG